MAWSNKQKAIAATACKRAGVSDEHRRLVLRQFENAMFDAEGRRCDEPTSRSKRLTNADFEQFMAIVERSAGGTVEGYAHHHWQRKADDYLHRMRHRAERIAQQLEAAGHLAADGKGLAGWISKRITSGTADRLDQLDYHGLLALILGLTSWAHQRGVKLQLGSTEAATA